MGNCLSCSSEAREPKRPPHTHLYAGGLPEVAEPNIYTDPNAYDESNIYSEPKFANEPSVYSEPVVHSETPVRGQQSVPRPDTPAAPMEVSRKSIREALILIHEETSVVGKRAEEFRGSEEPAFNQHALPPGEETSEEESSFASIENNNNYSSGPDQYAPASPSEGHKQTSETFVVSPSSTAATVDSTSFSQAGHPLAAATSEVSSERLEWSSPRDHDDTQLDPETSPGAPSEGSESPHLWKRL